MHVVELSRERFSYAAVQLMYGSLMPLGIVVVLVAVGFFQCTGTTLYQVEYNPCLSAHFEKFWVLVAMCFYATIAAWFLAVVCALIAALFYAVSIILGAFSKK